MSGAYFEQFSERMSRKVCQITVFSKGELAVASETDVSTGKRRVDSTFPQRMSSVDPLLPSKSGPNCHQRY